MAEITKRETRNRGERRPVVVAKSPPRPAPPPSKSLKRKAPSPPKTPEPLQSRDPPNLPSSREVQEANLSDSQWKSISDSGVLTASLKQSMERWRDGGCFEKYWVKNAAKKAHRDFQNPPSQSMVRLGSAMMTIEPHCFEVVLYTVRSPQPKPPAPTPTSKSSSIFNQTIPPYKPPVLPLPPKNQAPVTPAKPQTAPTVTGSGKTAGKPLVDSMQKSAPSGIPETGNTPTPKSTTAQTTNSTQPPSANNQTPTTQPPVDPSSNNPVIRELAHRASQNEDLKNLMKTVAQGGASEAELKEFQRHIDEINAMLRRKSGSNTKPGQGPSGGPQSSTTQRNIQPMTWTQPITPNIKREPTIGYQSLSNSGSKLPPAKSEVSAVVFEILSGTGDRYLVPKKSLLEFREGNRLAVLSFLVHLKGMNANGGFYESDKEYCELITFKLLADRPAILEPLRKGVDPPEIVARHMEDWSIKMTVAEKAHLVLRLRSAVEATEQAALPVPSTIKDDEPKAEYDAPNSLFPMHKKLVVGRS